MELGLATGRGMVAGSPISTHARKEGEPGIYGRPRVISESGQVAVNISLNLLKSMAATD